MLGLEIESGKESGPGSTVVESLHGNVKQLPPSHFEGQRFGLELGLGLGLGLLLRFG